MSRVRWEVTWLLAMSLPLFCSEVVRPNEPKIEEPYYKSEKFQKARTQLARLDVKIWTLVPNEYLEEPGAVYGCTVLIQPSDHVTNHDLAVLPNLNPIAFLNIEHPAITERGLEILKDVQGLREVGLDCADSPNYVGVTDEVISYLADERLLESMGFTGLLIHGETLEKFRDHRRLKTLSLRDVSLTEEGLRQIGTLEQVETLWLMDSGVTDAELKQLGGMKHLEAIALDENPLFGHGLAALANCPNLTSLRVEECFLSDEGTRSLSKLDSLESLMLGDNQIGDRTLEHLAAGGLKNLRSLDLHRTDVTDQGMKYLASLPSLASLGLSETWVTGRGMKHLGDAENLRVVDLRITNITDENVQGLSHLTQVTALTLDGTDISNAAIPVLAKLDQLEHLSISHTGISPAGIEKLRKALPECEIDTSGFNYDGLLGGLGKRSD